MNDMMDIKRNSGFTLKYMDSHIKEFDEFCVKNYPDKKQLDKELVEAWIYNTKSKSVNEIKNRIRTMRHLANYLLSIGLPSYYCPIRVKIPKAPAPHIFTDEQLTEFFRICDSYEPVSFPLYRHILIPVMFRTIYCCGLRNSEACNLKCSDVNLRNGAVKLIGSKGYKDRIIYVAADLFELCKKYNSIMETLLPNREYFFPSHYQKHFNNTTVCKIFDKILKKTSFFGKTSKKPTCHGLRYTFAVNSMRQCIANGENFEDYLQYLSRYMGHKSPHETMYYLHMVINIMPELREKAKGFEDVIGGVSYVEEW